MNWSNLGAADRRNVILGAIVVVAGVLSFLDPTGSWGSVVFLGILGGLLAVFVGLQPQIAPTMKLPATRGLTLLVAGALAAVGFVVAGLTWFSYVVSIRLFSIIFDIGLVAAVALLWFGWQAYQAEQRSAGGTTMAGGSSMAGSTGMAGGPGMAGGTSMAGGTDTASTAATTPPPSAPPAA